MVKKTYKQKYITALRRLKKELNIHTILFSGSLDINPAFAKRRKFDFFHVDIKKGENKNQKLNDICFTYNTPSSQVAFVGDDIQDLEIMKNVGFAFCPQDAITDIKNVSCILPVNGGDGVAAHLFEYVSNTIKS